MLKKLFFGKHNFWKKEMDTKINFNIMYMNVKEHEEAQNKKKL